MHYNVMMEGRGIQLPFEGNEDPVIGFHTTRKVWAHDATEAAVKAEEVVLAEWRKGGAYAQGGVPTMTTLEVWPLGWWRGLFTRARPGYSFYRYDD